MCLQVERHGVVERRGSPSSQDWIGVYHPGDPDSAYISWVYDNSCTTNSGTSSLASGSCSLHYAQHSRHLRTPSLLQRQLQPDRHLWPNHGHRLDSGQSDRKPLELSAGGTVTVSWTGVASPSSHDWIGVYHPGDPDGAYISWVYDNSCTTTPGTGSPASGSCSITMPKTPGSYELRLYANSSYNLIATSGQVTAN